MSLLPLLFLCACGETRPSTMQEEPEIEIPVAEGEVLLLARHPSSLVSVVLPPSSREGPVPERFPPLGGWQAEGEEAGAGAGVRRYRGQNPIQMPLSPVPSGFSVVGPEGQPLPQGRGQAGRWGIDGESVILWLAEGTAPEGYTIGHAGTTGQLQQLNRESSGAESDVAFLLRSERLKQARRHGVYLPAPASATWRLRVPAGARLTADAAMMRGPWRAEQRSDGATLVVEVLADDGRQPAQEVARMTVGAGQWEDVSADLSAWAGQQIHLRLRSEAGATAWEDYLLVGEPMLYTPRPDPRRIVLIFVDTLRADRLGVYGHARETTPNLDAWAADAAVFTDARSVAPWTYPAMRAALSGRMPDRWQEGPVLPERLAEGGWITTAFVNNAYLSGVFGMERGWGWHFYDPTFSAGHIVGGALNAMQKTPDRDMVLLLQFMDVHLPYSEPEPYRSRWVQGEIPGLTDPILRDQILGGGPEVAQYLSDRYDQSLRHLDKMLLPLLQALDEDDAVIFFSDHGEEFLEHGGLEHGHSLHDELLRVPLLIRAPGLAVGPRDTPASLLDLTPTVLDLAGLPPDPALPGQSLVGPPRPDSPARGAGYILHGADAWSVVTADQQKWILSGGTPGVRYDLATDPGEQAPQAVPSAEVATSPLRAAMEAALDRPVRLTWRAALPEAYAARPHSLRLSAPGGLAAVWTSQESPELPPPLLTTEADGSVLVRAGASVRLGREGFLPREIFAQPQQADAPVTAVALSEGADKAIPLAQAWMPQPVGAPLSASTEDALVQEQLQALGYLSMEPDPEGEKRR